MRLSRPVIACYLAAGVFAAALTVSFAAHAGQEHPAHSATVSVAQNARDQAVQHTQALMALQKQWAGAAGNEKSRDLEQLLARAQARQQFLLTLAETSPADVLRVAIPDEQQRGMPEEVMQHLEQKLEIAGTAEVFYEDYDDGSHQLRRFVKTPFGERFQLQATRKDLALQNGDDVTVEGVLLAYAGDDAEGTLVAGEEGVTTAECCTQESAGSTTPPAGAYTFGEQKTLVMLVNFQDKADQPYTEQQARDLIFGQASDFFLENSNDQTWLSGDVTGWYTLPISSASCDYSSISTFANEAALQDGIDTSSYTRYVYVFPKNACSWSGLGTVGGKTGAAWINGSFRLNIVAHELGHNFGLHHSRSRDCGASTIGDNCAVSQYGDWLDTMGNRNSAHFNAFQKLQLGWLDGLISADTTGTYVLEPYELAAGSQPKALRVLKSIDSVTGQRTWYYIEYRQALGFDEFLVGNDNVQNGVVVHTGTDADGNSSYLLDMTPDSDLSDDWTDPALATGNRFTDDEAGVTIATAWNDSNGVAVDVALGPPACEESAPGLAVSSGTGPWVAPGTSVTYTVNVTNNDSAACNSATIDLAAALPDDWRGSFTSTQFILAPGDSLSTEIEVVSSASAEDGFYDVAITAAQGEQNTTAIAAYVVSSPATNAAPVANEDTGETLESHALVLDVLANDMDPDGDSLSVETTSAGNNGTTRLNADGTITYQPNPGFIGTDSFDYTVSDGNGASASASVTIRVIAETSSAPVAVDDSALASKGGTVTIPVLTNDYDPDGDTLSIIEVTQGSKGSVRINTDGTLSYTAARNFNNTDSFGYTISDGNHSVSATVNVSASNDGDTGGSSKGKGHNK